MDYQKIYDSLIAKAKNRVLEGYKEKHHVTPKCLGGTNQKSNLVYLTAREHFICHWILHVLYPSNSKLFYAFKTMCAMKNKYQNNRYTPSSRIIAYVREEHSKWLKSNSPLIGRDTKGSLNGFYNKKHKTETIEFFKQDNRRKNVKERNGMWGKHHSLESNQARSLKLKGKAHFRVQCPHCGKEGGGGVMYRFHFNNCKTKK